MVYKLINEWKGVPELGEHEITVYKYNISHDEMVRYFYDGNNKVRKETFLLNTDPIRTEEYRGN